MYDVLSQEIRKYDQDHIILFEAVTWEVTGIGEAIGFTHPPGGFEYSNRLDRKYAINIKPDLYFLDQFWLFTILFRHKLPHMKSCMTLNGEKSRDWDWQAL